MTFHHIPTGNEIRNHVSPEDQDTLKLAAQGALTGSVVSRSQSLINAVRNVVVHRAALDAAQDEWDRLHGSE